jgi:hypothetical protein
LGIIERGIRRFGTIHAVNEHVVPEESLTAAADRWRKRTIHMLLRCGSSRSRPSLAALDYARQCANVNMAIFERRLVRIWEIRIVG